MRLGVKQPTIIISAVIAALFSSACHEKPKVEARSPSAKKASVKKNAAAASLSTTKRGAASRPASAPRGAKTPAIKPDPGAHPPIASVVTYRFDAVPLGKLPAAFVVAKGRWRVVAAPKDTTRGRVLAQGAANAGMTYNVVLATGRKLQDVALAVDLRAVKGSEDQGGGLVWRALDAKNYYVARYNPLEDNLRLYTVKKGHRKMLTGATLHLDHEAWHRMEIAMKGEHIEVSLDGKRALSFDDHTFPRAGFIGLWTKADAQTLFDTLTVRP